MLRRGFMLLFWGFLLAFLDIRINGLDLLPDFIGYIIITVGLGILFQRNIQFGKAKVHSQILIFLSLPDLIVFSDHDLTGLYFILALITVIFNILLIWLICQGIIEMAVAADNPALAAKADFRRKLVLAMLILAPCVVGLGMLDRDLGVLLIIPMFVLIILTLVLVLSLMRSAALELPDDQSDHTVLHPSEDGTQEEYMSES